jgi:hypothetical protein
MKGKSNEPVGRTILLLVLVAEARKFGEPRPVPIFLIF